MRRKVASAVLGAAHEAAEGRGRRVPVVALQVEPAQAQVQLGPFGLQPHLLPERPQVLVGQVGLAVAAGEALQGADVYGLVGGERQVALVRRLHLLQVPERQVDLAEEVERPPALVERSVGVGGAGEEADGADRVPPPAVVHADLQEDRAGVRRDGHERLDSALLVLGPLCGAVDACQGPVGLRVLGTQGDRPPDVRGRGVPAPLDPQALGDGEVGGGLVGGGIHVAVERPVGVGRAPDAAVEVRQAQEDDRPVGVEPDALLVGPDREHGVVPARRPGGHLERGLGPLHRGVHEGLHDADGLLSGPPRRQQPGQPGGHVEVAGGELPGAAQVALGEPARAEAAGPLPQGPERLRRLPPGRGVA